MSAEEGEAAVASATLRAATKAFRVVGVKKEHFSAAREMVRRHGMGLGLRSPDAIQLAVAVDLHSRGLAQFFVTADLDLGAIAAVYGLSVFDPTR